MTRAPDNPLLPRDAADGAEHRWPAASGFRLARRALLLAALPGTTAARAQPIAAPNAPLPDARAPQKPAGTGGAGGLTLGGTGMAIGITRLLLAEQRRLGAGGPATILASLGSSGGLSALRAGRIDIALAGRPLTPAEQAQGLVAMTFATSPLAVATQAETPADGVTSAEVAGVLSGEMASWPGGGPVRLIRRERNEGDWILLASLSPEIAQAVDRAQARPGLATAGTDRENADLLERIPGSFGIMSVGQASAEARRVKLLALDGVAPTASAVRAGRYRLSRALMAVTRGEASPSIQAFLDFLGSPAARALLRQHGYDPVPASVA
jgi:phosphate transport system substrate-binding protein